MHRIDFLVGQTAIHTLVRDAVTLPGFHHRHVTEFIHALDRFHQITSHPSGQFKRIILDKLLVYTPYLLQ